MGVLALIGLMPPEFLMLALIGAGLVALIFLFVKLSGSTYKNKWGYLVSKEDDELEHRKIAKNILGRNLERNEVVHHINGKRDDNRLINLCVMDRTKHDMWHSYLDWKKKKSGRYPGFPDQKQLLVTEYGGILLESFKKPRAQAESRTRAQGRPPEIQNIKPLFEALRTERKLIADEKNIKVYNVCDNHTLHEMALKKPMTAEELIQIKGIGYAKLSMYGERFLSIIRNFPSPRNGRDSA